MTKSRVAQLKPISIPGLELTAAVNVAAMLKSETDIDNIQCYYYTDSEIIIGIINSNMCMLATAYSISEIAAAQETGSTSQEKKIQPMKPPAV